MSQKIQRIAVLVESSRAYGRGLMHGISNYASMREDWQLYYHESTLETSLGDWLEHWHGDGILARVTTGKDAVALANSNIPTVDLLGEIAHPAIASVDIDNTSVAQSAVDFFLRAGFSQLAYCGYPGIHFSDVRQIAFEAAAFQEGAVVSSYRSPHKSSVSIPTRESWHPYREENLSEWLLSLPKPCAVFACNDVRALDVSSACRVLNLKVPEDVIILGVDNDELICGMSTPPLSSVEPDLIWHGARAAELLQQILDGHNAPSSVKIDPKGIVERPSTDLIVFEKEHVARALRYMRKGLHLSIGSEQIAREVGVSRSLLDRDFKEDVGHTVSHELRRIRLRRIRHLLIHTDLTLEAIADRTGFPNDSGLLNFFQSLHRKDTG